MIVVPSDRARSITELASRKARAEVSVAFGITLAPAIHPHSCWGSERGGTDLEKVV